jgi:hypothetical protein
MKKWYGLLIACLLSLLFVVPAGAAGKGSGDIPPPPPPEVHTQLFSGHLYLEDGYASMSDKKNGTLGVGCMTFANTVVDDIGCTMYLQKWDGSKWVVYGNSMIGFISDCSTYGTDTIVSITRGAYYRLVINHWLYQGSLYEEQLETYPYIWVP